jgi:hypothetical protein
VFAGDAEGLTAAGQHPHLGAGVAHLVGEVGAAGDDRVAVVEDEHELLAVQPCEQGLEGVVGVGPCPTSSSLRQHRVGDRVGVRCLSECLGEVDAARIVGRLREGGRRRNAALAHAWWARHRHEPTGCQRRGDPCHVVASAHQAGGGHRQVAAHPFRGLTGRGVVSVHGVSMGENAMACMRLVRYAASEHPSAGYELLRLTL